MTRRHRAERTKMSLGEMMKIDERVHFREGRRKRVECIGRKMRNGVKRSTGDYGLSLMPSRISKSMVEGILKSEQPSSGACLCKTDE